MNGSFVVSILIGVTAVLAASLAVTSFSRRRRAATRHALLMAAFAVVFALPVASALVPYATIRVAVPAPAVVARAVASFDDVAAPVPANPTPVPAGSASAAPARSTISLSSAIVSAWIVGLIICLVPMGIGLAQVGAFGRTGLPWQRGSRLAAALAASIGVRRRPGIVLHESLPGPMTYGTLRPTIVMPIDAEAWTD